MKMVLPYPPSLNRLFMTVMKGRVPMIIKTNAYRAYEGLIRRLMVDTLKEPYPRETKLAITLHFYRPQKRGDLDNTLKAMLDVLHGIAFENDDQVIELHCFRHDDKISPRASVEVWDVEEHPETNLIDYDATKWQEEAAPLPRKKSTKAFAFDEGPVG